MADQQIRKMWALVDVELPNQEQQLYGALDGRLFTTKPIPAHPWLRAVRVNVTIEAIQRPDSSGLIARRKRTPQ